MTDRLKKLKKWLKKIDWKWWLNFFVSFALLICVGSGVYIAYLGLHKVGEFLDIRTRSIETEKFRIIDEYGKAFFEIYKKGATTTLGSPEE